MDKNDKQKTDNTKLKTIYSYMSRTYYQLLTILSPRLNTMARYRSIFHRKINLEKPVTLNEKLLKLKLERYNKDSLVIQCADKYAVREYITKKGCSDILVSLIACYDNVDDIEWDKLPNEFAMKWNFGCGFNVICSDKRKLSIDDTIRKMKKWGRNKSCYLDYSEMHYKRIRRKIIVEEYLTQGEGLPADYKVYCFHGEPLAILFISDRNTDHKGAVFFSPNWEYLSETGKSSYKRIETLPTKPVCLNKMIDYSRVLSEPFPFVRMDYYVIGNHLYFGEMTFTPAADYKTSQCKINGKDMGEYLIV